MMHGQQNVKVRAQALRFVTIA